MLQIDLSKLSLTELRRMLETTRAHGQRALAARLQAELDRRVANLAGPEPVRMRADAAIVKASPPRRGRPALAWGAGLATIGVLAAGGFWATSPAGPLALTVARATQIPQPRIMAARLAAAPAAPPAPLIDAPAEAPAAPPPAAPAPAAAAKAPLAPARRNPCLSLPTPGERLVCGYPTLAARERQLAAAYARAAAVARDPRALDEGQLEWRRARDRIWDREQLAQAYDQRIRDLDEMTSGANITVR